MNALYAGMLVTLGFLLAALLAVLVLPAYRRRIDRFAREMIKRDLPLTEVEVRADRDRLRAENAMQVHRLRAEIEDMQVAAARQLIDVNRRDAKIHDLNEQIDDQKLVMEEHENARRVLEQAILDRLPKVEHRLTETRKLLAQRDSEIGLLSETASRQTAALEEATQINEQQRSELDRMRSALETRAARNRETLGDPRFDGEVALRSEIEALRAQSREQLALIKKLQMQDHKGKDRVRLAARDKEIAELKIEIGKLNAEYGAIRQASVGDDAAAIALTRQLDELQRNEKVQIREIARLKAALVAREKTAESIEPAAEKAASGLSAKAELEAIRSELGEAHNLAARLEAELASAQDKLSKQADEFRDELRRLSVQVVNARATATAADVPRRRPSLVERMGSPRPPRLAAVNTLAVDDDELGTHVNIEPTGDDALSNAMSGVASSVEPAVTMSAANGGAILGATGNGEAGHDGLTPPLPQVVTETEDGAEHDTAPRRQRLLDRISQLDKQ